MIIKDPVAEKMVHVDVLGFFLDCVASFVVSQRAYIFVPAADA